MVGKKSGPGTKGDAAETTQSHLPRSSSLREKEQWIGKQLRLVYEDALNDPVPEHILDLLRKLETNDPHKT